MDNKKGEGLSANSFLKVGWNLSKNFNSDSNLECWNTTMQFYITNAHQTLSSTYLYVLVFIHAKCTKTYLGGHI